MMELIIFLSIISLAYETDQIVDSDGDGLIDPVEEEIGTDPNNSDSDGDGEPDGVEVLLPDLVFHSHFENEGVQFSQFDVIFKKKSNEYEIVATNPGQFHYVVIINNTWDRPITSLSLNLGVHSDFVFEGSNSIKIYLDGVDITNNTVINGELILISNIPIEGSIKVTAHLDYGLKKTIISSLEDYTLKSHIFTPDVVATQEMDINYYYDTKAILLGNQKKSTDIAGFVTDSSGNPVSNVEISLYNNSETMITTTITDENGFYYFVDLEEGAYIVRFVYEDIEYESNISTLDEELSVVDFQLSNHDEDKYLNIINNQNVLFPSKETQNVDISNLLTVLGIFSVFLVIGKKTKNKSNKNS
jgi:5-hydroxyisourate hydrolase-like protein (transthyretin family)